MSAATLEKRGAEIEFRSRGRHLEGYAALFGTEARIGSFTESIRAGAFASSLSARGDILALVDHDPGRLLARTRSGSLKLAEDMRGLSFEIALPDTQDGRDVLALAERGDLGGMSFSFSVADENWTGDRRELRAVNLHEISVISAWPAYQGTSVHLRSKPRFKNLDLARRYLETIEAVR